VEDGSGLSSSAASFVLPLPKLLKGSGFCLHPPARFP
jgi:hypothetical protein